jgi:hypothetical protein
MYGGEDVAQSAAGWNMGYQDDAYSARAGAAREHEDEDDDEHEPGREQVLASYSMGRASRVVPIAAVGLTAALGLVITALAVLHPGVQWLFVLIWWAATVGNGYHFLVHQAYRLELTPTALHWIAPLRNGRIPLHDVVLMRPYGFGSLFEAIELAGNRNVLVALRPGFVRFSEDVVRMAPHVAVKIGALRSPRGKGKAAADRGDTPGT